MEKKKRKNRKPLIVVAMLLMVALVVGMGAMTYSRYVSSFNSGEQTATAAKWGYVITANTDNLFGDQYKKDGANATAKVDGSGAVVVDAVGTAKVVAPGTKGSMSIVINGVAEVLAKFTIKATVNDNKQIKLGTYMPVKWTLKEDGAVLITGTDLATVLNGTNGAKNLAPGTTLNNKTFTLEWEWVFGEDDTTVNNQDTVIGMKSAGVTWANAQNAILSGGKKVTDIVTDEAGYNAIVTELDFSLTVTLEQVQA